MYSRTWFIWLFTKYRTLLKKTNELKEFVQKLALSYLLDSDCLPLMDSNGVEIDENKV